MTSPAWRVTRGEDPILATALHAGHELRPDVAALMKLSDEERLREEDPYTDLWVNVAANSIIIDRSRFEVDLNRPREGAVYAKPSDAWGLDIWTSPPPEDLLQRSLELHDQFFEELAVMCDELLENHGHLLVLDIHSYNHRRGGPDAPVDDPLLHPEINLGTESIHPSWEPFVTSFAQTMSSLPFYDGSLDVRQNVKFRGGRMSRWINDRYGERALSIAIEVKKIYMDEWTGVLDEGVTEDVGSELNAAAASVRAVLSQQRP